MKINKLSLINFRNYANINIQFNDRMNIFVGNNAQGKTNILESLVLLSLTKSHRIGVNPNIIMFNKKKAKIKGVVEKDGIISKLEFDQEEEKKQFYLNNNRVNRIADYISNMTTIVFTPDDLEIIKDSPNVRRNLLNIQLSQISKNYLNTYNQYNKILKNRNEYLKILYSNGLADKKYLDVLTDKLIEKAVVIYKLRNDYINKINKYITDRYNLISNIGYLKVKYLPNINIVNYEDEEISDVLRKTINKNYDREIRNGMTLFGPHRDDFMFLLDDNDLKYFGSQGQQRLAVLAFKLSEIDIFEEYTNTKPILLLDDIFSEFDVKKRNNILKYINNIDIQSVLTTTDIKNINKRYLKNAYIYEVVSGKIERKMFNE